jgi:nucleoside-diphosphate-sugar epimerase
LKILVTGASGFLGRRVVDALAANGHRVRALVRPSTDLAPLRWGEAVEVVRADLRSDPKLRDHLAGVDAVVHLAAAMSGSDFARFHETVTSSERLFDAMQHAGVDRLLLCSSFSVYDWLRAGGTVDESSALLEGGDAYARGGYASAKLWQERLARRTAEDLGWKLTIIRPGFIWGRGRECPNGSIGPRVGPLQVVFAAGRQLPFTHVANAADCFRAAVENEQSIGETLNLVDGHDLTAWRFAGEQLQRSGAGGIRVWVPYWIAWPAILGIFGVARFILGPRIKLPFMFMPAGFAQGYRPLAFSTRKLASCLRWTPPLGLDEALEETFARD